MGGGSFSETDQAGWKPQRGRDSCKSQEFSVTAGLGLFLTVESKLWKSCGQIGSVGENKTKTPTVWNEDELKR